MKLTHAVVIRFHYPQDSEKFEWRLAYFQSMVLPKLLEQTYQDFDICIWVNPWHKERVESLSDKIKTFTVREGADAIRPEDAHKEGRYHIDFVRWGDVIGMDRYDIQTGLDSDDLIMPNYIETIQATFESFMDRIDGLKTMHLCFQPYVFDTKTLRIFKSPNTYTKNNGSAFFSLCQFGSSKYIFAYEYSHLELPKHMDYTTVMPEGMCAYSVHDNNESSSLPFHCRQILI